MGWWDTYLFIPTGYIRTVVKIVTASLFIKILKISFSFEQEILTVRIAIYSLQGIVSNFPVVQEDSFSLMTYVQPVPVLGPT